VASERLDCPRSQSLPSLLLSSAQRHNITSMSKGLNEIMKFVQACGMQEMKGRSIG